MVTWTSVIPEEIRVILTPAEDVRLFSLRFELIRHHISVLIPVRQLQLFAAGIVHVLRRVVSSARRYQHHYQHSHADPQTDSAQEHGQAADAEGGHTAADPLCC